MNLSNNKRLQITVLCSTFVLLLGACTTTDNKPQAKILKPVGVSADKKTKKLSTVDEKGRQPGGASYSKGGVVVAETGTVPNAGGVSPELTSADCLGPAFGVNVANTQGDKNYLFDSDGKPCKKPEVIFDGKLPVNRRQPPLTVDIKFVDEFGPVQEPTHEEVLDDIILSGFEPQTAEDMALSRKEEQFKTADIESLEPPETSVDDIIRQITGEMPEKAEGLDGTLTKWQKERKSAEQRQLLKESEQLLADLRDIKRISNQNMAMQYQGKVDDLMRRLRETKYQLSSEKERQSDLLQKLEAAQQRTREAKQSWTQQERELRQKMDMLEKRLSEFESLNRRLKSTYTKREQTYQEQIAKLASDLREAERKADTAQQEMVLDAAKKIAEAERLAFAARMARKEAMEREAERLRLEGDVIMKRANDLKAGKTVMVPGVSDMLGEKQKEPQKVKKPATPPLESVPVVLHVEDKPLKKVFEELFEELKPLVGEWHIAWEISEDNRPLIEEKWTVAAEARFDEFVDYVESRMRDTHGVDLTFQRFDRSKLFVVSDQ